MKIYRPIVVFVLIFLISFNTNGQHVELVKNINLSSSLPDFDYSSSPKCFNIINNKLYFFATTENTGKELLVTEGDSSNTEMLVSIFPGAESGVLYGSKQCMTNLNNFLFFGGNDPTYGGELYISDGTAAGTHMVKDIYEGPIGSLPTLFFALQDRVVFYATDTAHSIGLWSTDGTEQGTFYLNSGGSSNYVWQGKLYFYKDGGLWVSDGTVVGTYQVKAGIDYDITRFFEFQNKLFFIGGVNMGFPSFNIHHGFWQTDGTENGTSFFLGGFFCADISEIKWCTLNDKFYFTARDTSFNFYENFELWESDGTLAGTHQFCDINNDPTVGSRPINLLAHNNKIYFNVYNNGQNNHLMYTDGINPTCHSLSYDFRFRIPNSFYPIDSFSFLTMQDDSWFYFKDSFIGSHLVTYSDNGTELTGIVDQLDDPIRYKNAVYFSALYKDIGFELYKININDFPTSINNFKTNSNVNPIVKLFPNPTDGLLNVSSEMPSEMYIRNILGQLELKRDIKQGENTIDINSLKTGVYFASFIFKEGIVATIKFNKTNR